MFILNKYHIGLVITVRIQTRINYIEFVKLINLFLYDIYLQG